MFEIYKDVCYYNVTFASFVPTMAYNKVLGNAKYSILTICKKLKHSPLSSGIKRRNILSIIWNEDEEKHALQMT